MNFTERLRHNDLLLGTMLTIPAPEIAEMVAKCGFDWLFMDGEHSPLSTLEWQRMLQAVAGRCASIIRVPAKTEQDIKKLLISVPMVYSRRRLTVPMKRAASLKVQIPAPGCARCWSGARAGIRLDFASYVESATMVLR